MTSFEDRLLMELRQEVASRPAPTPRRGRWIAAGVGALGAVAAAVAVAVGGGAPAYAVEPGSNGTVTVEIHDLSDAAGLQRELRAAGVPAVVRYDAAAPACHAGMSPKGDAPAETGVTSRGAAPGVVPDAGGAKAGGGDDGGPSFDTGGARGADQERATTSSVEKTSDGVTLTIGADALPRDGEVYITTQSGQVESLAMAIC